MKRLSFKAVKHNGLAVYLQQCNGFTFEKSGYLFGVYRCGKVYPVIMIETGLQVAVSADRSAAPDMITDKMISYYVSSPEKIAAQKARFNKLAKHTRIAAAAADSDPSEETSERPGIGRAIKKSGPVQVQEEREPEKKDCHHIITEKAAGPKQEENALKPELKQEPKQEAKTKQEAKAKTEVKPEPKQEVGPKQDPEPETVEYSITPKGTVIIFKNGIKTDKKQPGEKGYIELLAAANAERISRGKEPFTSITAPEPEPEAPEAQRPEPEPEPQAEPEKQETQKAPEPVKPEPERREIISSGSNAAKSFRKKGRSIMKKAFIFIAAVILLTITCTAATSYKNYKKMVKRKGIGEVRTYWTEDLTFDKLENRKGDIIIEKIIGTVINNKKDGRVFTDSEYNYISYKRVKGARKGDTILTICIYNPDSNYCDDILERFDYIIDRRK